MPYLVVLTSMMQKSAALLAVFQYFAVPRQADATLAEGWGAHKVPHHEDSAEREEVTLTASGDIERPSSMVRRQKEHHHHHHHREHQNAQALFEALDIDGDGKVTSAELKDKMENSDFKVPKVLQELISHAQHNVDGGIGYMEFSRVAHQAAKHKKHHRHKVHHQHQHMTSEDLVQKDEQLDENQPDSRATWVTCGGHKAPSCSLCTTTDDKGQVVNDRGSEWCNGDCMMSHGKCEARPENSPAPAAKATTPTPQPAQPAPAKEKKPDILDPTITGFDKAVIDDAAEDAIKEENAEAAQKQEEAIKEAANGDGFDWNKFWLIVIVVFSVLLGICAIVSVVGVCVLCYYGTPTKDIGEGTALAEEVDAGEGEDAAEDAGES